MPSAASFCDADCDERRGKRPAYVIGEVRAIEIAGRELDVGALGRGRHARILRALLGCELVLASASAH